MGERLMRQGRAEILQLISIHGARPNTFMQAGQAGTKEAIFIGGRVRSEYDPAKLPIMRDNKKANCIAFRKRSVSH